jgi:integrase
MIDNGWCRTLINRRMERVRRAFRWATAEELVPVTVYEALKTLPGLQKGRSQVRESKPVKPVPLEKVLATLPFLPRHMREMVELMMYTGMRPIEVCRMTLEGIDCTGPIWTYKPTLHKTSHRGKERVIPLGPKARAVLSEFLNGRRLSPEEPLFSPVVAREERFAEMRKNRKSKVPPSQANRKSTTAGKLPSAQYKPLAIAHAVRVACEKLYPLPAKLARRKGEKAKDWRKRLTDSERSEVKAWWESHHWHAYQLRHTFGTLVRKQHGLEAAGAALGHSKLSATEVYAERNLALAEQVAKSMG